ncbi:MAG: SRPBCC family protein [Bacteroidota bacterium]
MQVKVAINTIFYCSLERAFKTPLLCDVSKIHTGYGVMPKVTHCTEDENWGQVGARKKVFVAKSISQKGGFASVDSILEREENYYWKFEVGDFQSWMLGFTRFTGEWKTTELEENKINVEYTYTLHSNSPFLSPLNYLFAKTFWKIYMKRALENVRKMTVDKEPYQYP